MTTTTLLFLGSFLLILFILAKPLGNGIARLIDNDIPRRLASSESLLWRLAGVKQPGREMAEMNWRQYALAIVLFNLLGFVLLFVILICQGRLPLNPQHFEGMSWDLAFNTAVSFVTNTNWQAYSGENTLSYLSQMAGLTVQNFLSAATGLAVAFAIIRAFSHHGNKTVGNAWLDIYRITVYLLFPLAIIFALFFVSQGVIQNFSNYLLIHPLDSSEQLLPMGPVASQEAIKLLGTNGGGFFGSNSSHPFENPTALSNFVQMLAIFLIPTALCFAFGRVVGNNKQGHTLLWVMGIIFVVAAIVVVKAEYVGNPFLAELHATSSANMEGKRESFWDCRLRFVCRRHHRSLLWSG